MDDPNRVTDMLNFAPRRVGSSGTRPACMSPTIVVVDPRPGDYEGWSDTAETNGARLHFVSNAADALRLSRTTSVDLWVVETELPGLSGYELCGMLKARSTATAVLLVTDDASPSVEQRAWQARATMFACKPAHLNWLDAWLDERRLRHGRRRPPARSPVKSQMT